MHKETLILSTRPMDEELIRHAADKGITVEAQSFIETEPLKDAETAGRVKQVSSLDAVIVFTSMNAVDAVHDLLGRQHPDWKIYCIGNTTRRLVEQYFGASAIEGTANDASALAEKMIADAVKTEIFFFCGDQRRNELPEILSAYGRRLNEIIVYKTTLVPRALKRSYDGVLFFSPTAVESFFQLNKPASETVMFAIGNTTAGAIQSRCGNPVVVSELPGKENLLKKAISYFNQGQV